jgi:glyoxylase-like metal-dependent hydrolase (beta-lactamase superfamily II)
MNLTKLSLSQQLRVTLVSLSVLVSACSSEAPPEEEALDATAILSMAVDAIGGSEALANLNGTSHDSERYSYIMGQGPFPGQGLAQTLPASIKVSRDYDGDTIRLDSINRRVDRDNSIFETSSSEILSRDAGYLQNKGFMDLLASETRPLRPDQWAGTKKTERLLNPHAILKELVADPSMATVGGGSEAENGRRYSSDEVFPVTTSRRRQTGARSLIVTEQWLNAHENTPFFNVMAHETTVDDAWLDRWHAETAADESTHHRLVVDDDIFPITLYVHKETGLISKLSTMEWDVTYGDVPLEVSYDDWQVVDGVNVPHRVRLSFAGAPRIDSNRSNVMINPEFDAGVFAMPADATYVHNEETSERGRRLSQTLLMFGFAGVARPTIESLEIRPGMDLLFASPIDGVYSLVVEQDNGVVVMESGQNDLKGEEIIKWIGDRYPGKPISHLILSHHHNDHSAGMRPYVAAGATLVVHGEAVETYRMHASRAPSTVLQDALDRNPAELSIVGVPEGEPYRIEDSKNPIVVYPLAMAHVTDMIYAYVEGENILYSGDLYIGGLARDIRSGSERGPDILPFHAGVSLAKSIEEHNLEIGELVSTHDRATVTHQDLINYISDE